MKSVVSEKGQVTLPKKLRDRLGIRPGQVLDFETVKGALVARKVDGSDPVDRVYGVLKDCGSTDRLMRELRGPADEA